MAMLFYLSECVNFHMYTSFLGCVKETGKDYEGTVIKTQQNLYNTIHTTDVYEAAEQNCANSCAETYSCTHWRFQTYITSDHRTHVKCILKRSSDARKITSSQTRGIDISGNRACGCERHIDEIWAGN